MAGKAAKPQASPEEAITAEATKAKADADAVHEGKPHAPENTDSPAPGVKAKPEADADGADAKTKPMTKADTDAEKAKAEADAKKGVIDKSTLDKDGKPKRPLSQDEKTLEEWRAKDTSPDDLVVL